MIRGEDRRARWRKIFTPLDDNLAEKDLSDQAKKGEEHIRLSSPVYSVCPVGPRFDATG
jgi:hypothetical protein